MDNVKWGYRILLVLVSLVGVLLNLGILQGMFKLWILAYYTILSNLMVALYYLFLCLTRHKRHSGSVKGCVVLAITITMLVYHTLLAPRLFAMDGGDRFWNASNLIPHYIVPCMVLLDWLVFDKRGNIKRQDPFRWLVVPTGYFLFANLRALHGLLGSSGSRYPYFFLDVDVLGWGGVARWALVLAVCFLLLGYVLYFADRIIVTMKGSGKELHRE